jgi:hypothetical protein
MIAVGMGVVHHLQRAIPEGYLLPQPLIQIGSREPAVDQ